MFNTYSAIVQPIALFYYIYIMLLDIDKTKTGLIRNLKEFVIKYNAQKWLEENIKYYDEYLNDDEEGFKEIVKRYFSLQDEPYSLLVTGNGIYVSCYSIKFVITTKRKTLFFRNFESAQQAYERIAIKKLAGISEFENYPKDKLSFDVLKRMIDNQNIALYLIKK